MPGWEQKIKIPKIIFGCGVNALEYGELADHVKRGLHSFDSVGLRDNTSLQILNEPLPTKSLRSKTYLSFDPSMALTLKHKISWRKQEGVGIVVPTDRKTNLRDNGVQIFNIIDKTKSALKFRLHRDEITKVVLLAFGGDDNNDYHSCMQLETYLEDDFETSIVRPETPVEALKILSRCSRAYTYRLHGLIFAYMLGAPYYYFPYHWKVTRIHTTLPKKNMSAYEFRAKYPKR